MSENNEFDFDNLFDDQDEDVGFDIDDDEGMPSGLGDEMDSDMPEIEDEPDSPGPNRTFVVLAGVMILLFVVALVAVLFLATRPTGPSDLELTASQVVMLNSTVLAQGAETSTQQAADFFLTQTAAAWTQTPSPTLSPTPTQPRATVTPTPPATQDLSLLLAETLTAQALNAPPTATPQAVSMDLRSAFATQLAFATQQGQFDQSAFATRVANATQSAGSLVDPAAEAALRNSLEATQSTINQQQSVVQTAIAFIDQALVEHGASDQAFAADLGNANSNGLSTQAALGTPFAAATNAARATQSALATLSADVQNQNGYLPVEPGMAKANPPLESRAEMATQAARMPFAQDAAATATAAVLGTQGAQATGVAQATLGSLATQAAQATRDALGAQGPFATQAAIATQVALATRQALIDRALGVATSTPSGGGLDAVNQTATAIAAAFLTATAQAYTPQAATVTVVAATLPFGGPQATALPTTGIFDDVVGGSGGSMGFLALAVFGLVGVIFVSRRLRSAPPPPENQDNPPKNDQ